MVWWIAVVFLSPLALAEEIAVKPIHSLQLGQICHRPEKYSIVTVRYTASLLNGQPIPDLEPKHSFQLDVNRGIKGIEKVVKGMCIDEKVEALIPSAMAYGPEGHPDLGIPEDADLLVEIELLDFKHGSKPMDAFSHVDTNLDGKLTESEVIEEMLKQKHLDFEFMSRNGEQARVEKLEMEVHEVVNNFINIVDKDGDSYISRKEWANHFPNHDEF